MKSVTRQQIHGKLGASTSKVNMKFAVETAQRLLTEQTELNTKALEALSIVRDYLEKSITGEQLEVARKWARGTSWPTHELSAARWAVFGVLAYIEDSEVASGYVRSRAIEVANWAELAAEDNFDTERNSQLQCVLKIIAQEGDAVDERDHYLFKVNSHELQGTLQRLQEAKRTVQS